MKVRVLNSLLMGVVVFSLIFLTGCGTLETLVNKDGTSTSIGDLISGGVDKNTSLPATANSTSTSATTSTEGKTIALYFADSSGKYLVKEERTLPKTASLARETVSQWIKGPAVKGATAQASVPTTTILLDIALKENVAIVDLSKEFLQPNSKISPEVALYGLVNTLTQFSTIKQVQIRIEGKPLTKYGAIDATKLVNKASLVKSTASASTNPILPENTGTGKAGSGVTTPGKTSNGSTTNASPSSINLFDYGSSSSSSSSPT